MLIELNDRFDISLENYERVTRFNHGVRFSENALRAMQQSRDLFMQYLDSDENPVVYGVTSGYGSHADRRFNKRERLAHAAMPPRVSVAAFGAPLPEALVRGIIFARLANFVEGHAAVSPAVAVAVANMLTSREVPSVPGSGQAGAGELLWLAALFNDLAETVPLAEKDSLSLINGSPVASAMIADAYLRMRPRLDFTESVFALSIDAIHGPLEAYDAALEDLWNDPHEVAALRRIRSLLEKGNPKRRPYQAPVSYRIVPRVLGWFRRCVADAENIASNALSAVTDSPVFIMPKSAGEPPRVLSNGGFHNASAYPILDNLAGVCADMCTISERHTTKLLTGRYSLLPDHLIAEEGGFLSNVAFVQAGYCEEAKRAAARTFIPGSEAGSSGQNDVAPPHGIAWSAQQAAGHCLDASLCILAVVASQALYVAERAPPPALKEMLAFVRDIFPPMKKPRKIQPDLERLLNAVSEDR